jgi:hypothetical protein
MKIIQWILVSVLVNACGGGGGSSSAHSSAPANRSPAFFAIQADRPGVFDSYQLRKPMPIRILMPTKSFGIFSNNTG